MGTSIILLLLLGSVGLVLLGHLFRLLRWEQFIRIYERPARRGLLQGMAGGYAVNFLLPFHVGDVFRAVYAGRRMKSGTGFALATVIMDRFLDVWIVALCFGVFRALGLGGSRAADASGFYLVVSLVLVVLVAVVSLAPVRDRLKKICLAVCSIFNDTLRLDGMVFCWSLINTFKDLRRVHIGRLLLNTLLMWTAYLGSYSLLACAIRGVAGLDGFGMVEVFTMLFGRESVDVTSLGVTAQLPDCAAARVMMLAWYLLPLAVMFAVTLLPEKVRGGLNRMAAPAPAQGSYLNLLPQADPGDRSAFLSQYFGLQNKSYVAKFIEINQNITILQDYSAGSNATTMLCMDEQDTFYRKYAFGADGDKLAEQLDWLRRNGGRLPLCHILRSGTGEGYCWYDMDYAATAVGMFRYIHSNPVEKSAAILRQVLTTLDRCLYAPTARAATPGALEEYLDKKVDANLEKIRESRTLRELWGYDRVWVNGVAYKNLGALGHLFDHDALRALFAGDPIAEIHGDLTIENIICRTDAEEGENWYLIDPNTGNVHDSPFLDFGKLLQSLHGGYEFLMMTPRCTVQENRIDFAFTRSAAYDALFSAVRADLEARYTARQVQSIFAHELIHWLRLMPYKLSRDKKRAPMFYAGLLMVANDIDRWYGEEW
ncbi:MAG: lysylphosphatidylglycerol synthase transmembrane domain-containing protein [Gemmiger sp.]